MILAETFLLLDWASFLEVPCSKLEALLFFLSLLTATLTSFAFSVLTHNEIRVVLIAFFYFTFIAMIVFFFTIITTSYLVLESLAKLLPLRFLL